MKKFEYFEKSLFKGIANQKVVVRDAGFDADYIRLDAFFNLFKEAKRETAEHFRTEDDILYGVCACGNNSSKNRMFCSNCNAKILATIEREKL